MCPYCQGDAETEEHILWQCAAWPLVTTVRRLAADLQELPAEPNRPPCLKLCGLAPRDLPSTTERSVTVISYLLTHSICGDTRGAQVAGSTAAGPVCRAHTFQQTERIPTPPTGGPPSPAHRAGSSHGTGPHTQELALGTLLPDRSAPVAHSVALAGRTKHSHLFRIGPGFSGIL